MTSEWDLIAYKGVLESDGQLTELFRTNGARSLLVQFARAARAAHTTSSSTSPDLFPPSSSLTSDSDDDESQWQKLQAAVGAVTAFVQLNWTGPDIPDDVRPVALLRWADPSSLPQRSVDSEVDEDETLEARLNSAATDALTTSGEPAYHLCKHPFLLVFALRVLDALQSHASAKTQCASSQFGKLETLPWWRLRAAALHNKVLDEPVALSDEVLRSADALIDSLNSRIATAANDSEQPWWHLQARLLIERGLALSRTGHDKEANDHFTRAAGATNLRYELSGALGKRTKFQREEKTILVVLAESSDETLRVDDAQHGGQGVDGKAISDATSPKEEGDDAAADALEAEDVVSELPSSQDPQNSGWKAAPTPGQRSDMPSNYSLNDELLLEQTRFTSNADTERAIKHRDPTAQPALAPLDQCILLALSLSISNTSPEHGLTSSQISAFVSRVAMHPRNWSVYTMALLLRSRLEATRTRTAERAVLQLQALLDQMPTADSSTSERLAYFFQLDLPAKWELQAQLAKLYATLGVLRSALEIYERIELWEEVVQCLGALGRQEEGIDIVKDLLEGKKTEAGQVLAHKKTQAQSSSSSGRQPRQRLNAARQGKLWCLLGDLEPENAESHYLTGWSVSSHHSSRAARSLGGLYFAKEQYAVSIRWLHRALRISSLMPRSWFMLGCAYMRGEEWGKAARSFRRVTAIDEEDGEAWNNLASCYLRMVSEGDTMTAGDIENDDVEGRGDDDSEDHDDDDAASDAGSVTTVRSAATDRTIKTDSGVDLSDSEDVDGNFAAQVEERRRTRLSPFILKTLAHRCLKHALRYAPDSWKVWSNFMIVSVDIGELGEACRAFGKTILFRVRAGGGRLTEEDVDWEVLERLVDAVIRAPGANPAEEAATATLRSSSSPNAVETPADKEPLSYNDAMAAALSLPVGDAGSNKSGSGPSTQHQSLNPNVGRGLYPAVLDLFTNTLLPTLSSPRLHRAHARLLVWKRQYSEAIEAHLAAYRCSVAAFSDNASAALTSSIAAKGGDHSILWREAVTELRETVDSLETLATLVGQGQGHDITGVAGVAGEGETGPDAEKKVRFKARSLVRTFLSRNKDMWESSDEWDSLVELRDSLK
ncbi:unnamed protein product [Parajaminaea phylloscopi]